MTVGTERLLSGDNALESTCWNSLDGKTNLHGVSAAKDQLLWKSMGNALLKQWKSQLK